tara:strand:- start:7955 stop:8482 length:528 start_codon:yes stop_codon:yes gene_type:complete
MPGICKVGITKNLEKRLDDLNKTSTPTRFQVYASYKLDNAEIMEQEIFQHFSDSRLNRKREFLQEHPERVCDFIQDNKSIRRETDKNVTGKFTKLGIAEGEVLKFKEGEDIHNKITATVGVGNNIIFRGRKTSLSKSAQIILREVFDKNWKAVQGSIFWTYKGKTIRELMDDNNL